MAFCNRIAFLPNTHRAKASKNEALAKPSLISNAIIFRFEIFPFRFPFFPFHSQREVGDGVLETNGVPYNGLPPDE
ncbi:hypothetical protein CEXT_619991 [Caerostris extrusa]|uniref:Uncharacterized protein n=1 Tax=Caerostris extrusa TaxID=172846 RepID=A0AAV4XJ67_CAEEX|nr:hypothetical protein CEXT_619991 [Caerostris extrusa]